MNTDNALKINAEHIPDDTIKFLKSKIGTITNLVKQDNDYIIDTDNPGLSEIPDEHYELKAFIEACKEENKKFLWICE